MPPRLKNVIAVWFVLQIVLPFTAPLQTCALADLLPASSHSDGAPLPHESSAMPLLVEAASDRSHVSSPVKVIALPAPMPLTPARGVVAIGSRPLTIPVSSLQPVRQTVLRL
jgi:hypothetical protein